jgi:hypothetical protein
VIPDGQNQVRCRIVGTVKGRPFEFIDPDDSSGSQFIWGNGDDPPDLSLHWWSEGNMACDCNRRTFLPDELKQLVPDECGDLICIDRIEPLVEGWPSLVLNETTNGHE